jgi:hypothetical protein
MIEGFAIGISLAALFVSVSALLAAALAIGDVWAFKRSTHNVQFVSAEDEAKEALDDTLLNKTLDTHEFKAMQDAFGQEREPKQ